MSVEFPLGYFPDLYVFLRQLNRGDKARCFRATIIHSSLYFNWGEVWKVRKDGMLDLRFNLKRGDIEEIIAECSFLEPRSSSENKLIITNSAFYTEFQDIDEINSRDCKTKSFYHEHDLVYKFDGLCSKCKAETLLIDAYQWRDTDKKLWRCLQCLPKKVDIAMGNAGTDSQTYVTVKHIEEIIDLVNALGDDFPSMEYDIPELPDKDDFNPVDEMMGILAANKPYKGYKKGKKNA